MNWKWLSRLLGLDPHAPNNSKHGDDDEWDPLTLTTGRGHARGRQDTRDYRAKRKARRQMAKASRRRNRRV